MFLHSSHDNYDCFVVFRTSQKLKWETRRWVWFWFWFFSFSAVCAYVPRSLVILVLASSSPSSSFSWSLWLRESDNSTILKFQSDFSRSLFSLHVRINCLRFSVHFERIFVRALCVSYACSLPPPPPLATIFPHRYALLSHTHTHTAQTRMHLGTRSR